MRVELGELALQRRQTASARAAFEEALRYITTHDGVWLATGREIARHFIDHYYDAFAAAAQPVGGVQ